MSTATTPTIVARGRRAGDPGTERPADRRRRRTVLVVAAVAVVGAALVGLLTQPRSGTEPLSPDSAEPDGARAAAQVLQQQGVDVTLVTTTAAALAEAEAGSTLLVVDPGSLRQEQQEALGGVAADVVITALDGADIGALTDRVEVTGYADLGEHTADCDDPDAQAAGRVVTDGALVTGDVDAACFATADGALYATWTQDGATWRVLSDHLLTNGGLAAAGNAALVLRSLGAHDRLVWYLPDPADTFGTEPAAPLFPLPAPALLQLLLVGVVLVLWRGRRLGPVVVEPLPVLVRATETTRGRGRLYRRAGAHAHAAAALRAGLVARVAPRLGLPNHALPDQVVDTLARASGRDRQAVHDVLYGPGPTDDDGLVALTRALDTLEAEVQRA